MLFRDCKSRIYFFSSLTKNEKEIFYFLKNFSKRCAALSDSGKAACGWKQEALVINAVTFVFFFSGSAQCLLILISTFCASAIASLSSAWRVFFSFHPAHKHCHLLPPSLFTNVTTQSEISSFLSFLHFQQVPLRQKPRKKTQGN